VSTPKGMPSELRSMTEVISSPAPTSKKTSGYVDAIKTAEDKPSKRVSKREQPPPLPNEPASTPKRRHRTPKE